MAHEIDNTRAIEEQIAELEKFGTLSRVFTRVPGWELLKDMGTEIKFKRHDCLLEDISGRGTHNCCFLVLKGSISVRVVRGENEPLFYNVHRPGSIIYDASCALGVDANNFFLEALEDAVVRRIPRDELLAAAEANTDIYMLLLRSCNAKFVSVCTQVREISKFDAVARVYNLLVTLAVTDPAVDDQQEWISVGMRISQQTLADILGINRITVVKALGQLTELGRVKKIEGVYAVRTTDFVVQFRKDTAEE